MSRPLRVLVVEDSEDDAALIVRALHQGGYEPEWERVQTREDMASALDKGAWDIVLADYTMPQFSALSALEAIKAKQLDIPFIIISGSIGEETAVSAMKAGANDYMMKGNLSRLIPAVERELREAAGRQQRRQLESQLQQAQKMELIGQLAGGIAHDFNNVLTVIQGNIDVLEDALASDEKLREVVQDASDATENGAALTRQLLAFARQQEIKPEEADLNELIKITIKLLRRVIGQQIRCEMDLQPNLWKVRLDPGQFTQVLVNLAVNARDAMPCGGTLSIDTQNLHLDPLQAKQRLGLTEGDYVMLAVGDTGIGMDESVRARIFEPYYTTKAPGKGTGLGLATCYGIVKQSGGDIWADSSPGQGTRIKIMLPRAQGMVQPAPADD